MNLLFESKKLVLSWTIWTVLFCLNSMGQNTQSFDKEAYLKHYNSRKVELSAESAPSLLKELLVSNRDSDGREESFAAELAVLHDLCIEVAHSKKDYKPYQDLESVLIDYQTGKVLLPKMELMLESYPDVPELQTLYLVYGVHFFHGKIVPVLDHVLPLVLHWENRYNRDTLQGKLVAGFYTCFREMIYQLDGKAGLARKEGLQGDMAELAINRLNKSGFVEGRNGRFYVMTGEIVTLEDAFMWAGMADRYAKLRNLDPSYEGLPRLLKTLEMTEKDIPASCRKAYENPIERMWKSNIYKKSSEIELLKKELAKIKEEINTRPSGHDVKVVEDIPEVVEP